MQVPSSMGAPSYQLLLYHTRIWFYDIWIAHNSILLGAIHIIQFSTRTLGGGGYRLLLSGLHTVSELLTRDTVKLIHGLISLMV